MPSVLYRLSVLFGFLVLAALPVPTAVPAAQSGARGNHLDAQGDPLPEGALARIGGIRLRHNGEVGLLAFAPDGKSLFSLGADQTFRRWEVATGKEQARFEKKGLTIYISQQMANRQGGRVLVGGVKGGLVLESFSGDGITAPTTFTADGKTLAFLDVHNAALVLDVATGKTLHKIDLKDAQGGHALALTGDGKLLAVSENGGEENSVRIWDLVNDKELSPLKLGKQRMATKLLFSPDGKQLAAIVGPQVRVWDVASGKRTRLYEGHDNVIAAIAFSADGKHLASASLDATVRVWETGSEEEVKKFTKPMDQPFTTVAFAPNGKYLLAGGVDRTIQVWNLANDQVKTLEGHALPLTALAVSPDATTVASADTGGAIRLWDLETGKERETVKQPERLHGFGMYDGGRTLALWSTAGKVRHVGTLTGREHDSVMLPTEEDLLVEVAPDGRTAILLSRGEEETVRLWDGVKGKELHKIAGHTGGTIAVSYSPDSKLVVTSGADNTVRIWQTATGKEVLKFVARNGIGVTFSPDGKLLAVQCEDDVCLFETATTRERCRFKAPNANLQGVCFSPDSRLLATNNGDDVVRLWDLVQGKLLRGLVGHEGAVQTAAFAPQGDVLATGGSDGTVRLWNVQNGKELRCFEGHEGLVQRVAFSDDGKLIISAGSDNCILVWDATARTPAKTAEPVIKKVDQLWTALGNDDGPISFKAMGDMIGMPGETVKFLGTRLQPVPAVPATTIEQMVDGLDHKNFNARQKATKELEKLGGQARPQLEKVLANPPSPEVEARIKKLLERLDAPVAAADEVRMLRAIEVLERIATPEARDLLTRLARGAPGARLTHEAAEAQARLKNAGG